MTDSDLPELSPQEIKEVLVYALRTHKVAKQGDQAIWLSPGDGSPAIPLPRHPDPLSSAALGAFLGNADVKRKDFLAGLAKVRGATATSAPPPRPSAPPTAP